MCSEEMHKRGKERQGQRKERRETIETHEKGGNYEEGEEEEH